MLINNKSELLMHMPDMADVKYEHFIPFLKLAARKVAAYIGTSILDVIQIYYNEINAAPTDPPTEIEHLNTKTSIVFNCQAAIVYYAVHKRLPLQSVVIGENGIEVRWSDQYRPAQASQSDAVRKSLLDLGHECIERLIESLNEFNPTEWGVSPFKSAANSTMFVGADQFNYALSIDNSARFFNLLCPFIRSAQLLVSNILGTDRFASLLSNVHGTLSEGDQELLDIVRPYLAKQSVSQAILSVSSEDLPACLSSYSSDRDSYSSYLKRHAENDINALQKYINDLDSPDDAPHESIPDNTDTTKKTFRL